MTISAAVPAQICYGGGNEVISFSEFNRSVIGNFNYPTNFAGAEWPQIVNQTQTRIVPMSLNGQTIEGQIEDGEDTIRGDEDNDWLFGGGADDQLIAGTGIDYVDGGAGNDYVDGGDGDDVLRGGANDDVLLGGIGIDQLFGDAGTDRLFGDAGTSATLSQSLIVRDSLVATVSITCMGILLRSHPTILLPNHKNGARKCMGARGDWIYGSIRRQNIFGDAGNDTIQGDALFGPYYTDNANRALVGGSDIIYGGTGEDRIYGGGGNDLMWGGADSDWLEGQNGLDTSYGGTGIDILLLDTSPLYSAFLPNEYETLDGHGGNELLSDATDDNATDILQIEGTDNADTVLIGQSDYLIGATTAPR